MRSWWRADAKAIARAAAILMALAIAAGCAGPGGDAPTPLDPLEQNAVNALSLGLLGEADDALHAALNRYTMRDDLEGQWRIRHMMANLALSRDDVAGAREQSEATTSLSGQLESSAIRYESLLLEGRVSGRDRPFREALRLATSDLQRAVCYTYLGETERAAAILGADANGSPSDLAFVYYRHAKASSDSSYYLDALEQYRRAGDSRGMADTLVNMARLAERAGDRDAARRFSDRAIAILSAINDGTRANAVRTWQRSL